MSNNYRKEINAEYNKKEYALHEDAVHIKYEAPPTNKGQSMYIWPGIILQSYCTDSKSNKDMKYNLKTGLFYKVLEISKNVKLVKLDKDMNNTDEEMSIPIEIIPQKLLLSYAFTYYKSQARTIKGSIRLAETHHKHFTLRHLIVGLGRAPLGEFVQVA